jgi:hypothetical protein
MIVGINCDKAGRIQQGEMDYSIDELMCVCISRQAHSGDILAQGLATPLVAAGYLLARETHAQDIYFASAIGQSICRDGAPLGLETVEALWLDRSIIQFGFIQAVTDLLPALKPKEFFRPGQVDLHGNFNNVSFGKDPKKPRLRLPGTGGIPDVSVIFDEVFLYVPRHSRVTFVEQVDFISGLGCHPERRFGGGPVYLLTDLGQFDFVEGRMRLTHLHPGVRLERVISKTAFKVDVSGELTETEPPSFQELDLLRNVIDPLGIRRLEFLSGPERRRALREIIRLERSSRDRLE